jgi:hypothetical protein
MYNPQPCVLLLRTEHKIQDSEQTMQRMILGQKKKMCLRSPDRPYFSADDPNLFNQQLFDPNFC